MRERRTYGSVRGLRCEPLVYSTVNRDIDEPNELHDLSNILVSRLIVTT